MTFRNNIVQESSATTQEGRAEDGEVDDTALGSNEISKALRLVVWHLVDEGINSLHKGFHVVS